MQTPEFTFDHPIGLRIARNLRESDVVSLDGVSSRDMRTGYVWYSVPSVASESDKVLMSLCFRLGLLDSISIAASDVDLGSSWGDWSEEKERRRAKRTAAWLAAQATCLEPSHGARFGQAMIPRAARVAPSSDTAH